MLQVFRFTQIKVVAVGLFEPCLFEVTPAPVGFAETERLRQTLEASLKMDANWRRAEQLIKTQLAYSQVELERLCEQSLSGRRWQ